MSLQWSYNPANYSNQKLYYLFITFPVHLPMQKVIEIPRVVGEGGEGGKGTILKP